METRNALQLAQERDLDLVEVSPSAKPPVCRIMDYGKYKYEQSKKLKDAKKKQHTVQLKEMRFTPSEATHDYEFKLRHIRNFIDQNNRVKVTVVFKGRQNAYREFGRRLLDRVQEDVEDIGKIEAAAKSEGRTLFMILSPK